MVKLVQLIVYFLFTCIVQAQFGSQNVIDDEVYAITKIVTNDLNNDGFQDIVVSQNEFNNNNISYFLNTGGTAFDTQQILTTNVTQPQTVATGDLNGDGWNDIVASSNYDGNTIFWFENDNGIFLQEVILSNASIFVEDIELNDIDNDNDLDIVVLGHNEIVIFYNDGLGNFTEVITEGNDEYYAFSVADLDNDGFDDIVIGSGEVMIFMNNNGSFSTHDIARSNTISNDFFCFLVKTADLNDDGNIDLILDLNANTTISWLENTGNGFFGTEIVVENTLQCNSLSVADFNQDGHQDIFAVLNQEGEAVWYENDGLGNFSTKQIITTTSTADAKETATADINNDGLKDVIWDYPLSFHLNQNPLHTKTSNANEVSIYPNPVQNSFTINSNNNYKIDIINYLAQHIYSDIDIYEGENHLNLHLKPQIYFINFKEKDQTVFTKKLIKQ